MELFARSPSWLATLLLLVLVELVMASLLRHHGGRHIYVTPV